MQTSARFWDDFKFSQETEDHLQGSTSAAVDQFCGHVSQIMKNPFELTGG
jgi:hypothetical protein